MHFTILQMCNKVWKKRFSGEGLTFCWPTLHCKAVREYQSLVLSDSSWWRTCMSLYSTQNFKKYLNYRNNSHLFGYEEHLQLFQLLFVPKQKTSWCVSHRCIRSFLGGNTLKNLKHFTKNIRWKLSDKNYFFLDWILWIWLLLSFHSKMQAKANSRQNFKKSSNFLWQNAYCCHGMNRTHVAPATDSALGSSAHWMVKWDTINPGCKCGSHQFDSLQRSWLISLANFSVWNIFHKMQGTFKASWWEFSFWEECF